MNKSNVSQLTRSVRKILTKHSPEILTGIGVAGMIATTVMAVRATPKALMLIEDAQYEKGETLTTLEKVKAAGKPYIPAAVTGTMSIACLIGASSVNVRRNAALATAYTISETALKEYQEKVVETIGEKKEQTVRDKIAKDKIDNNPIGSREVIITEKGDTLCYDVISGRYFKSDIDKLNKIENELNRQMMNDMYISVNDFYSEIGLSPTSIGNDLGWNIDHGLLDLHFSSQLAEDGTPCLVVDYHVAPRYDYRNFM